MLYFIDNLTVHFQNLKMRLHFHQAVPPQRNNSEENTKQKTTKIEDYQVIHTRRNNLQWFPAGLVIKHKLLKRVGKKGLYDAGPQLWQHGVQRPPTPSVRVALPWAPTRQVYASFLLLHTARYSCQLQSSSDLLRTHPSKTHQSYAPNWISTG